MNEIESLSSKLRLSEINSALGMELSRKIEVEPISPSDERQNGSEEESTTDTVESGELKSPSGAMTSGSISNRLSRYIAPPTQTTSSPRTENKNNSRNEKSVYRIRIQVVINMYRDLTLQTPMEFEMIVPRDYITAGNLRLRILDRNATRLLNSNTEIKFIPSFEGDYLHIPWMEGAKYPLSVWFFAVRELFKKPQPGGQLWTSSVALSEEFCVSNALHKAKSRSHSSSAEEEISLVYGVGKTRGKRNYMEDVDFALESIRVKDKATAAAYGVLDGHGGKQCADFALDDLPSQIVTCLRSGSTYPDALYSSFLKTDKEFLDMNAGSANAGCTANVLLFDQEKNVMYVANTGDTRAVLCQYNNDDNTPTARDLTIDRKATDPEEVARIAKAGGFVVNGRVLGSLAISRALGDCQLKEGNNRIVVPDPEISAFSPSKKDQFIIVATDGLWDVMSSQSAVEYVNNILVDENLLLGNSSGRSKEDMTLRLNQICLNMAVHAVNNLRSADNVTVMVIIIQGGKDDPANGHDKRLGLSDTFSWLIDDVADTKITNRSKDKDTNTNIKSSFPSAGSEPNLTNLSVVGKKEPPSSSSSSSIRVLPQSLTATTIANIGKGDDLDDDDDLMSFLKDDSNF